MKLLSQGARIPSPLCGAPKLRLHPAPPTSLSPPPPLESVCAAVTVVMVTGILCCSLFRPGRSCGWLAGVENPGPGRDTEQGRCPC